MKRVALLLAGVLLAGPVDLAWADQVALPTSLERVKRKLAQAPPSTDDTAIRLQYFVEVYGRLEALQLFDERELQSAAPPYGGMTHQEFLNFVTPQEFRAPVADIGSAVAAFTKWAARRAEEKRKQEERLRIEAEAQYLREHPPRRDESSEGTMKPDDPR